MRFVVLGAGALGTVIAAYLARAGEDVALIARGARAKQLANEGVTITGLEDFTVKMEIVDQPANLDAADVLIMATKTYDTATAIDAVRHVKVGSVFSIQNGVMKNAQLAEAFGEEAVLGAVGMLGGAVQADGVANYMMANPIIVGEISGEVSPRVEDIIKTLQAAKLPAAVSDNIQTEEWSKFVGWLGLSALAVLTRAETWKFLADGDTARIAARIMRETAQLPQHLGIPLKAGPPFDLDIVTSKGEDEVVALLQRRGEAQSKTAPNFRQSMLQDVDKGKQFEVEETFGFTVREAEKLGLSVPTVETCYRVLAGLNRMIN
ncbi:MAG: ketopantoate reductase family protein [Alphaproteobacteria bacterium]|nr:ketopantoate reductase family protein [Alphaproteobacteria bacterium]